MSFGTLVFLTARVVHVMLAAVWLGSVAVLVLFAMPAMQETGPAGVPMVGAMARRGLNGFLASLGGITVLTGFYLYWRLTGRFDPALSATRSAMVFGTGGIAGLAALIVGGSVVGRNMKRMGTLAAKAMALPDGPDRGALLSQSTAARDRGIVGARIVLVLQMLAAGCMALGHYV